MADIRIKDLATTAASTASDDFIAVDGSANGTRKLNAFSPTFGGNVTASGNLTVSGTGTSSFAGSLGIATTSPNKSSFSTAVTVNGATNSGFEVAVGDTRIAGFYAASSIAVLNAFANVPLAFSTNNTTQMQLFANGNLFIGASPTDGGQKLQVSGTGAFTGDVTFGSLAAKVGLGLAGYAEFSNYSTYGTSNFCLLQSSAGATFLNAGSGQSLSMRIGNVDALVIDSSKNATFAGSITNNLGDITAGNGNLVFKAGNSLKSGDSITYPNIINYGWDGAADALYLYAPGNNNGGNASLTLRSNGSVICNSGAVATNATVGFLYVPACAGTPTGTPASYTGRSPIVVDSTNNKLYFYSGGAWRDAGP